MTCVPDEALAALEAVASALGRAPVAAILSGSAVAGGLRPLSDVDLLVVVEDVPDAAVRGRLAAALMAVSGRYGAGGPPRQLDVTLVVRGDVVVTARTTMGRERQEAPVGHPPPRHDRRPHGVRRRVAALPAAGW